VNDKFRFILKARNFGNILYAQQLIYLIHFIFADCYIFNIFKIYITCNKFESKTFRIYLLLLEKQFNIKFYVCLTFREQKVFS